MTWRSSPQPPEACYCGEPIPAEGPSDLYCSPACQTRWLQKGHDYLPIPARPEWRMGASESDWRRSLAWPDVPALPPQEVRQWIEDTDPAPVEAPLDPQYAWDDHDYDPPTGEQAPAGPQPPLEVVHLGDIDERYVPGVGMICRIFNATRRNT